MKIFENTKISELLERMSAIPECRLIRVTDEGSLELGGRKSTLIGDFLLLWDGAIYMGSALSRHQSVALPEGGLTLGLATTKKILLRYLDGTAERVTPNKKASDGCRFLLAALLPGATLILMIDGGDFMQALVNAKNCVPVFRMALALASAWSPEYADKINEFWNDEDIVND